MTPVAAPQTNRAYTVRLLPVEEWDRLRTLPFASVVGLPDPNFAMILVGETAAGEIVSVWEAITTVHLEGAWTHPDHRHTTLAGRMLVAMRALLARYRIWQSFTIISDPAVMVLAHKAGFVRAPGDLWMLHLTPTVTDVTDTPGEVV